MTVSCRCGAVFLLSGLPLVAGEAITVYIVEEIANCVLEPRHRSGHQKVIVILRNSFKKVIRSIDGGGKGGRFATVYSVKASLESL